MDTDIAWIWIRIAPKVSTDDPCPCLISGGEMRRVSIDFELVAELDMLILDEPMSGLSLYSFHRVVS
jgi:energy-coupling factor transporter ATP-binding protein EcfA2